MPLINLISGFFWQGKTMNRLENKVAVITGAASGIGRASSLLFAEQGCSVVVTDLNAEGANAVAEEIIKAGGRAVGLKVDVGEDAELQQMVAAVVAEYGKIDILFNNAVNNNQAMSERDRDFLNFDTEVFYANMKINTLAGVLAAKYALPHMLSQQSGSIIFTSSTSSTAGEVSQFTYGASKAAVNWYIQTIAATYGKQGIRCNGILPGVIRTPSMEEWTNQAMVDAFLDIHNSPRLGLPEDIAAMALFLASDEACYINGGLYPVDGGINCGTPMVPVVRKLLNQKF
jgi:NAD(P)-dependent dehydrogenase (short-subunit alcohol dehydrogenase family)